MANTELGQLIASFEDGLPKALRKQLRPALREASSPIVADAKRRASWSTRIPAAIRASTSLRSRKSRVSIVVDRHKAPHARPFENLGLPGVFRHPVFGNYDNWVSQKARPFLFPAVFSHVDEVQAAIDRAVNAAATEHGFR